jgi:hypothetical protein
MQSAQRRTFAFLERFVEENAVLGFAVWHAAQCTLRVDGATKGAAAAAAGAGLASARGAAVAAEGTDAVAPFPFFFAPPFPPFTVFDVGNTGRGADTAGLAGVATAAFVGFWPFVFFECAAATSGGVGCTADGR